MQRANDVTLAAYKAALATLREGMTQDELDPATSSLVSPGWDSAAT